ncbi:Na+ dependent nucleoside transporter N-terminal domain-containing protein [Bifidobacterium kimbladii]|uniref:Na+ dependent nucleoside transporter N-terminal domain-containing protein n=1 Tax=Bifidobacterium kimbladii TaxID=1293826 RepID=UPI0037C17DFF
MELKGIFSNNKFRLPWFYVRVLLGLQVFLYLLISSWPASDELFQLVNNGAEVI